MLRASWVATEGGSGATDWGPNMENVGWGLERLKRIDHDGKTWCYISMIVVVSNFVYVRILNTLGFFHCVLVIIEKYSYCLVHYWGEREK